MGKRVTFGVEVANALRRVGVAVLDRNEFESKLPLLYGSYAPYHLPEGTTLTSEQVAAAVGADPGKLAARWVSGASTTLPSDTYVLVDGEWRMWSYSFGRISELRSTAHPGSTSNRVWYLVAHPELERVPEQPLIPAQGTTLRAIMEWCARTEKGVVCERPGIHHRSVSIDGEGDLETSEWLSPEDIYVAADWQAMADGTTTWFVPGQANPSEDMAAPDPEPDPDEGFQGHVGLPEESGPKETVNLDFMHEPALPRTTRFASEAMAHGEAGGVVGYRMLLCRLRDGYWELRAAYGEDTWDRPVRGEWEWAMGTEYTLYPADYMDDAPKVETREGPELWAWMCRTGRMVESPGDRFRFRVRSSGVLMVSNHADGVVHERTSAFPRFPCVPADGRGWDDEVDRA